MPIFILSADRPGTLVGTGANQTIDQKEIFGNHVRFFYDMGLPNKEYDQLERYMGEAICHLKGANYKNPPGPVHLNFPFDEPLFSNDKVGSGKYLIDSIQHIVMKKTSIRMIPDSKKPLFVIGANINGNFQDDLISLAEKINAPILADPLSQVRYGFKSENIISHYDIFLKKIDFEPDFVLRIGFKPTSKILCNHLDQWKEKTLLVSPYFQHNDDCSNFVQSLIDEYLKFQINVINWRGDEKWLNIIKSIDGKIEEFISLEVNMHEGLIARVCQESVRDDDQFMIGNSMPIRDVDGYTNSNENKIITYANRGASGIDGVLSTALGMSYCNENRSLLLIGDLSFYHDMNGLLISKYEIDLTIVVINNEGGGIFSFLPMAEMNKDEFKEYWTTNTGLDLMRVAALHSCHYESVTDLVELKKSIKDSFNIKGIKIIEIKTVISENVALHQKLMDKVAEEITN